MNKVITHKVNYPITLSLIYTSNEQVKVEVKNRVALTFKNEILGYSSSEILQDPMRKTTNALMNTELTK